MLTKLAVALISLCAAGIHLVYEIFHRDTLQDKRENKVCKVGYAIVLAKDFAQSGRNRLFTPHMCLRLTGFVIWKARQGFSVLFGGMSQSYSSSSPPGLNWRRLPI